MDKTRNEMVTNFGFYGRAINSLNDEDVRVTDRITLPRNNLKGFQAGRVGQLITQIMWVEIMQHL